MQDDSQDVPFVDLNHTLSDAEMKVVEQIITRAVLDSVDQPKDTLEQHLATQIKLMLEHRLQGAWNCVVGDKFGVSVNVESNTYGQFFVDDRFNVFIYRSLSMAMR